jgi:hypothetical protein
MKFRFCYNNRCTPYNHSTQRWGLRRWLRFKHKTRRSKGGSYSLPRLYEILGLVRLTQLRRDVPWTKA